MSAQEQVEGPVHDGGQSHAPSHAPRRDPFGIGLTRRPDWETFGVVAAEELPGGQAQVDDVVEVRRSGLVTGVVGIAAAGPGLAWLGRALAGGGALDWSVTALLAVVALAHLTAFVDARVPLAVLDGHGVRMRLGRTWQGLPWESVDHVAHARRSSWWRDGRLVVEPFEADEVVAALDRGARWHAWWAKRWYGGAFALPVGLSTRVRGADDLGAALETVVDPAVPVHDLTPAAVEAVPAPTVEAEPAEAEPTPAPTPVPAETRVVEAQVAEARPAEAPAPDVAATPADRALTGVRRVGPWAAGLVARVSEWRPERRVEEEPLEDQAPEGRPAETAEPAEPAVEATPTPAAARTSRPAVRAEVHAERPQRPAPQRRALPEETVLLRRDADGDLAAYEPAAPTPVAEVEEVRTPVVGPVLTEARRRLGLSIDQVAERTRIRPHVIEAVEVDDFGPCGGDFYARGHLRTLARVLGVDAAELVERYDAEYADAPVDARRVFEAELATVPGGAMRATRGGPNWSVLVAAVMALVVLWSAAQMLFDGSTPAEEPAGSAGLSSGTTVEPVGVVLTAPDTAVALTVRDGAGEIVWQGEVPAGGTQDVQAAPPVRVSSSDGAVTAAVDGGAAVVLGEPGVAVQRSLSP